MEAKWQLLAWTGRTADPLENDALSELVGALWLSLAHPAWGDPHPRGIALVLKDTYCPKKGTGRHRAAEESGCMQTPCTHGVFPFWALHLRGSTVPSARHTAGPRSCLWKTRCCLSSQHPAEQCTPTMTFSGTAQVADNLKKRGNGQASPSSAQTLANPEAPDSQKPRNLD